MLGEEPAEEFEDLRTIGVMPDEYALFEDDVDSSEMSINAQKQRLGSYPTKAMHRKINADHDEIDVSSDDSNLEGKNHIEHFFSTKFSVQLIYTICIFISKKLFLLFFTSYSASIIDG